MLEARNTPMDNYDFWYLLPGDIMLEGMEYF